MPLGVVTDDEFAAEIINSGDAASSPNSATLTEKVEERLRVPDADISVANTGEILELKRGRGNTPNTPLALQQLIGESALSSRKESVELASLLGISPSSASAYANGATSTASYNKPKPELFDFLNNKKQKIAKRAGIKLLSALDNITEDKLSHAKVSDLALVAKSMSGIIKDMEPPQIAPTQGNTFNGPSIIMYAPPLVDESRFQSITVQE